MKIKIKKKNRLIKLKLIETKIYSNTNKKNPLIIGDIVAHFKKALSIIYKYHTNNKRILFVGSAKANNKFKNFLVNTRHILLPNSIWMNGIITNTTLCVKRLVKKPKKVDDKFYTTLTKLNRQVNLIVILESDYTNNILHESYLAKIPTILLDNNINKSVTNVKASYIVPGDFNFLKKQTRINLIYLILSALFKKINFINLKINTDETKNVVQK